MTSDTRQGRWSSRKMKGFFDNIKYKEHPLMFFIDQDFLDDFHLSPGTNKLVHIQLPQALFV